MATVTARAIIWNTTAGNKTTGAFTPAAGELLVAIVGRATTDTAPTISDSQSGSWTLVDQFRSQAATGGLRIYVRDSAVSATSMTVTMTGSGDAGGGLAVLSVSDPQAFGASAVLGNGGVADAAAGTPSVTLDATPNAANVIVGAVMTNSNSTTNTAPPTDFTEDYDQGFNTPPSGLEVVHRNSGHTSTTVAWTAATATTFAAIAIEIQVKQNLTGVLFTKAPTFPQGNVQSVYTITGTLFTKAPTFPAGEVTQAAGGQTLNGVLFTKAPTFFVGKVYSSLPTLDLIEGFEHQSGPMSAWTGTEPVWGSTNNNPSAFTYPAGLNGVCLRIVQDGSAATRRFLTFPLTQHRVVSLYFRVPAAPTATYLMFILTQESTFSAMTRFEITSAGNIRNYTANNSGGVVTGPDIDDGLWHRLDFYVNTSGSTWTTDWAVDGVAQTQTSASGASAANSRQFELASNLTAADLTFELDDMIGSPLATDYPLGVHAVFGLFPNGDGTHNAGTNVIEANDGTDIGTAEAFSLIDNAPPIQGTYIKQVAIGSGNYAEVTFPNILHTVIRGLYGYVFGGNVQSAQGGNGAFRIVEADGDTVGDIFNGNMGQGAGGTETQFAAKKSLPYPGGVAWTQSLVNDSKGRVGFSNNASGTQSPLFRGLLLQYSNDGARYITGILFTKTPTFPQGSVTTLTTLTGVLFSKSPTFPQGAVNAVYALSGVLFTKAPTFPTGAVTVSAIYDQAGFRGRNDDGDEDGATWKAAENVDWEQNVDENFRVRFVIDDTGSGTVGVNDFKVQYNKNGAGWNDVNAASSNVRTVASGNVTNAEATTRQLTSGTGTYVAGSIDENNGAAGTANTIESGEITELEFVMQIRSVDVADNDTIDLRIVETVGTVVLDAYSQVPTITVNEAAAPQTLSGVLFTKAPTFPQGQVRSVYTLTGVLFTKTPTFPQGAVQAKYTLTGVLFTKAPTFPQGAVQARYTLAGVLFSKIPTFPQGQVQLLSGPQTLTGVLFAKAPTFPAGQVRVTQNVTGVLFTRAPTFPTGQVTAVRTLTGVTFAKAPTFFVGQVRSVYTVTGVLFTKSGTFFVGSVTAGAATLQGVVFVRSPFFPVGAVLGGAQLGRITRKPAEYSPIIRKRGAYGSLIRK